MRFARYAAIVAGILASNKRDSIPESLDKLIGTRLGKLLVEDQIGPQHTVGSLTVGLVDLPENLGYERRDVDGGLAIPRALGLHEDLHGEVGDLKTRALVFHEAI